MASDRNIKANRANARKSTGPRSSAGKKRASRNALRHGLTAAMRLAPSGEVGVEAFAEQLVQAVRPICTSESFMLYAREIARWEFQLERIRRTKLVMLECAMQQVDPKQFNSSAKDHSYAITAEALRKSLPEFRKFSRYEQHAVRRRDAAIRSFVFLVEKDTRKQNID
jgi:hypothetical protein